MKKKYIVIFAIVLILLFAFEIYLRCYWGFCDTILSRESDKYEYIAQANQNRFRFRKHIRYNEYSMRSAPLQSTDKIRILGFGDSVVNGGVLTEQDSLATSIIEKQLTDIKGEEIRCLNISCGSWGPDNCFAYLQEHGDFNANLIFMVVSSHDAYDNMDFRKVVDVHPSYPSRQYKSALYELFYRYLLPRILKKQINKADYIARSKAFNPGFLAFLRYTRERNIPFFIYLHPNQNELQESKYGESGERIIRFCSEHDIRLISGMEHESASGFRDGIHLNEHGQRILADALLPEILRFCPRLNQCPDM